MCRKPVLFQPNFTKHFYLQTDASAYGVGAILLQSADAYNIPPAKNLKSKLHPLAYYSATFLPAERNYDIYERELLAVMKALVSGKRKFP